MSTNQFEVCIYNFVLHECAPSLDIYEITYSIYIRIFYYHYHYYIISSWSKHHSPSYCIWPVLRLHQSHHLSFKHYAPYFRYSSTPIAVVAKVQRRAINYPPTHSIKITTNLKVNIVAEGRGPVTEGKMNILSNPQRKMSSDHLNRWGGDRQRATAGDVGGVRSVEGSRGRAKHSHSRLAEEGRP